MLVLVIAPFFTSFLIRTLAWQPILADQGCRRRPAVPAAARARRPVAGHAVRRDHRTDVQLPAVHGAAVVCRLEKIDPRLIEAAGDLYASPISGFFKVTWPLSLAGVVAGTLLTFIPAAATTSTPSCSATPRPDDRQRHPGPVHRRPTTRAAALSMTLMMIIVAMVFFYVRGAGRRIWCDRRWVREPWS